MPTNLPKVVARFETTLASSYSSGNPTFTIASGSDANSDALSGYYGVTIDGGTANEQFDIVTISGTTCTVVVRDCKPSDPTASRSRAMPTHRKGASVKVTDYGIIAFLRGLLNGDLTFDNLLSMTSYILPTSRTQLVPKGYVDDSISGASGTASTSTYGTVKTTTSTNTVVSTDDSRVPTANQTAGLSSTTALSASNKAISQTDSQKGAETYALATGSANAYVGAYSPVISALTVGMKLSFKANFTNTGAATFNPGPSSASIVKNGSTALVGGDITSGMDVPVQWDGTNWQMLCPIANAPTTYASGIVTISATGTTTITPGFRAGKIDMYAVGTSMTAASGAFSQGGYTASGNNCVYRTFNNNGSIWASGSNGTAFLIGEGTNPTNTSGTVSNITSTSFDIVATKGTANATIYWEASL